MAKSTVPLVPLQKSTFQKTWARNAAAVKLKRLGFYLALDRARRFLTTKSPLDWVPIVLVILAIAVRMATTLGLPYASQFAWVLYSSVALFLIATLLAYIAQKLGLIDLACFRKKSFERDANGESAIYVHQKPEVPIAESVTPPGATAENREPPIREPRIEEAINKPDKTSEWQTVEIKNLGKIRYHLPALHSDKDRADE
jgi:hypothetical protein